MNELQFSIKFYLFQDEVIFGSNSRNEIFSSHKALQNRLFISIVLKGRQ